MWSPSRSASSRRFRVTSPSPSPMRVPSLDSSNGQIRLVGDSAGVLLKHVYMKISLKVSIPPVITMSACPHASSIAAMCTALKELPHAASTTLLLPPRLNCLLIRPATTLPRRPGKEFSCHGTYSAPIRSTTSSATSAGTPESSSAFFQMG